MHCGLGPQTFRGSFERGDSPVLHLLEEDIECGLVELDDVHPRRLQILCLLIEDRGEFPGQLLAALVVVVIECVDHRHRSRQRPLDRLIGLPAEELRIVDEHRFLTAHGADDCGNACVVAIADSNRLTLLEIDSAEMLDERRHEVLAGLLSVADDVDAAVGLLMS